MDLLSRLLEARENGSGCSLSADEVPVVLAHWAEESPTEAFMATAVGVYEMDSAYDWTAIDLSPVKHPEPQDP